MSSLEFALLRTQRLDELGERLHLRLSERLREYRQRLHASFALLQSLGPQAVLARGYAIAQTADGAVLRDPSLVASGDTVNLTLAKGRLETHAVKR